MMNTSLENKLSAAIAHMAHVHTTTVNRIVFRAGLVYFNAGGYTYYVKLNENGAVVPGSLRLAPTA